MCGIVGALAFGKLNRRKENSRQKIMRYVTRKLLLATESRGKDATGAAILFDDGNYIGVKRGDKASDFLSKLGKNKECYGGLLEVWKKCWKEDKLPVRVYLGHTRSLTQGPKEHNENNHPIKIGNLIGVHNGTVKNDDDIFKNLGCKRDGKVDSEAIFRLFDHFTHKGKEPFTLDMVQEVVRRLDGSFAVTLFNADNPYQVPVFRDGKPVELVFIKEYKLLFIMSDPLFWSDMLLNYELDIFYDKFTMPSLLSCTITKESLIDDSCIIFDLTTNKITAETKIHDLGEWRKMERTDKIWTTSHSYSNYRGITGHSSIKTPTKSVDKDEEPKKKRVFNKILKKYVASGTEKDIKPEESVTLPVGTSTEETGSRIGGQEIKSTDKKGQDQPKKAEIEVKDLTIYDKEKEREEAINKDRKVKINKKNGIDGDDGEVIDIDMTTESPEFASAAEDEYKGLDLDRKGYGNLDEVLNAAEIENEKQANKLGKLILANRVFKDGWKKGFIIGCKYIFSRVSSENARKRERHIYKLKSLVLLLAGFFDKSRWEKNNHFRDKTVDWKLSSAAMEHMAKYRSILNMEDLGKIFNSYERRKISQISGIISKAAKHVEGENN